MFVGLYTLAGFYLYRRDRRVVDELLRLVGLLGLFVVSVALAKIVSQFVALTSFRFCCLVWWSPSPYHQEMSLLLSLCTTLVVVVAIGHGLPTMALAATVAGAVLVLRQVRTRSRLLIVRSPPPRSGS